MINILFVDDNLGFIHLFKELLVESSIRFNLVEASNPLEGLEQFIKYNYNFHYIICDFFLPIQNGTDFLDIVKSHNSTIVCLLISADESLRKKVSPSVDCFFSKSETTAVVKYLKNNAYNKSTFVFQK